MLSGPGHIVGVAEPTAPGARPGAAAGVAADRALLLRDPPLPGRVPGPLASQVSTSGSPQRPNARRWVWQSSFAP